MPALPLSQFVLIALLLAAAAADLKSRRIPNRLLAAGLTCAAILHLCGPRPLALLDTGLAGFASGLLLFLPLYCLRGMAAGDVKLMATVGAFTGPAMALQAALAAFCAGGLMALIMILASGRLRDTGANLMALLRPLFLRLCGMPVVAEPLPTPSVGNMPYALAIAGGTFFTLARPWL
ncbi:prepilin peptidase [Massilia violaceinigra]|uniref:Prepilin peptidase n=1 Tax=Massilia violaceinigra TaxID=2045208 RepID=A0ABY4ACI9_9BURK|nr:prepilin peptidase [Massilia violaceinigra]UOD32413.1 prepilin peptidase [Massilia violaceinigra]